MLRNLIVASLFVIAVVRPVRGEPIIPFAERHERQIVPFALGMSASITVPANERVELPAFLMNTGTEPLVFDDISVGGWGWGAGPGDVWGLGPLNIQFGAVDFAGVTIPVGGLFTFPFSSILFDPRLTTQLHPNVDFFINLDRIGNVTPQMRARIPALTISIGPQTEFGPLIFVNAVHSGSPIPEPSTLVLLLTGGAVAGLRSSVRKRVVYRWKRTPENG